MADLILIDTHVLVYAAEVKGDPRSKQASNLIDRLIPLGIVVTTAQVVTEFYRATTRAKSGSPMLEPAAAAVQMSDWLSATTFLPTSAARAREALRLAAERQLNIYDAHLLAIAQANGVRWILTEDLPGERVIEGVRYINPFSPAFEYAQIGL